jgi:hypothetical protein
MEGSVSVPLITSKSTVREVGCRGRRVEYKLVENSILDTEALSITGLLREEDICWSAVKCEGLSFGRPIMLGIRLR